MLSENPNDLIKYDNKNPDKVFCTLSGFFDKHIDLIKKFCTIYKFFIKNIAGINRI